MLFARIGGILGQLGRFKTLLSPDSELRTLKSFVGNEFHSCCSISQRFVNCVI